MTAGLGGTETSMYTHTYRERKRKREGGERERDYIPMPTQGMNC